MAPPAEEDEGLRDWEAARKCGPTGQSALRGAAHDLRCESSAPDAASHNVTPASTLEQTTTASLTVASLPHPPTALWPPLRSDVSPTLTIPGHTLQNLSYLSSPSPSRPLPSRPMIIHSALKLSPRSCSNSQLQSPPESPNARFFPCLPASLPPSLSTAQSEIRNADLLLCLRSRFPRRSSSRTRLCGSRINSLHRPTRAEVAESRSTNRKAVLLDCRRGGEEGGLLPLLLQRKRPLPSFFFASPRPRPSLSPRPPP